MKITFIKPSINGTRSSDALEPLAILILYSLTPDSIETDFFDERIESLPSVIDSDVIVFSVETFSAKRAYLLSERYKDQNPSVKIIMGGFHVTACPEEALQFADSVVIGDAEGAWEQVVEDLLAGDLKERYASGNPYILPFRKVKRDIFDGKKYRNIGVVQWKRGCVYRCDFCSVSAFYTDGILEREIDDVIDEIRQLKRSLIFIADDNILGSKEKLTEFVIKLAPLKKKWVCQVSINIANDEVLLDLMAKSGCKVMIIGFETLNLHTLRKIGKISNINNYEYNELIKRIYQKGIMIFATFIFGYPGDVPGTFDEIYRFAMRNKFLVSNFNPLMAMPATALYNELHRKDTLVCERWWIEDGYAYGEAMHRPDTLSCEQLTLGCKRLRYRYYSFWGIFRRLSRLSVKNFYIFLAVNIISAVEVRRKQQKKLGEM
jgi:radical SAM superfamily enzyme YgiQ (UPF0313 family)